MCIDSLNCSFCSFMISFFILFFPLFYGKVSFFDFPVDLPWVLETISKRPGNFTLDQTSVLSCQGCSLYFNRDWLRKGLYITLKYPLMYWLLYFSLFLSFLFPSYFFSFLLLLSFPAFFLPLSFLPSCILLDPMSWNCHWVPSSINYGGLLNLLPCFNLWFTGKNISKNIIS